MSGRVMACLVAGAMLLARAHPVGACVCYESNGLAADFHDAAAVFAGKVVALEVTEVKVDGQVDENMVATLKVERHWKGPKDALPAYILAVPRR